MPPLCALEAPVPAQATGWPGPFPGAHLLWVTEPFISSAAHWDWATPGLVGPPEPPPTVSSITCSVLASPPGMARGTDGHAWEALGPSLLLLPCLSGTTCNTTCGSGVANPEHQGGGQRAEDAVFQPWNQPWNPPPVLSWRNNECFYGLNHTATSCLLPGFVNWVFLAHPWAHPFLHCGDALVMAESVWLPSLKYLLSAF